MIVNSQKSLSRKFFVVIISLHHNDKELLQQQKIAPCLYHSYAIHHDNFLVCAGTEHPHMCGTVHCSSFLRAKMYLYEG